MKGNLVVELIDNLKIIKKSNQPDVERLKAYDLIVDVYTDDFLNNNILSPQSYLESKLSKLYGCNVKFDRDRFRVRLSNGKYAPLELSVNVLPKNLLVQIAIFLLQKEKDRK